MRKTLPGRPNLDHLRKQAKQLLSALEAGDREAIVTIVEHLPAAKGKSADEVRAMGLRLADAQSAIARKTGFAAWPHLARHVQQLRSLEGTWAFAKLEVEGNSMPATMLGSSRLLIDGDRFRTETPDGVYEGVFNINVETEPHEIDIEFVEGPEAGNCNYGIYQLRSDELEICLDVNGKARPTKFATKRGSGHAWEVLQRTNESRPADVKGGTAQAAKQSAPPHEPAGFNYVESPTLAMLAGEWDAISIVTDGNALPDMMLKFVTRTTAKNEMVVSAGGRTMIRALMKIDEANNPVLVDYYNLEGASKGTIQLGILKWEGDEVSICMAAPGQPRPDDFACAPASGRTLSQWKKRRD
jgi:uncharacterized protein (TIGR03067 family)